MKKTKSKVRQRLNKNPIEQLLGTNLGNWDEMLGLSGSEKKQRATGDLLEGQELNLKELQGENLQAERNEKEAYVEPAINYSREIINVAEKAISRMDQEIEVQLREIMDEIKKLADTSKELQVQFKAVAVEQRTVKPGKYHKSFFSWLLSVIRTARMKVEDSGAWLAAMKSKKKARGYWESAKKHGTSFSLSNERNVATQVG